LSADPELPEAVNVITPLPAAPTLYVTVMVPPVPAARKRDGESGDADVTEPV
jgi:hypothetical protein